MREDRLVRLMPYGLLALATVVAVVASPALVGIAADLRPTLALAAVTAGWMWMVPNPSTLHFVGRTVLAFALCWLNPLYAVFAFVGFHDVYDSLPRRWVHVGIAAVAITQGGAQSGGLPPDSAAQAVVFAALFVLNAGVATTFMKIAERTELRTLELERVNAELAAALAENAVLNEQLVSQARETGVQEERQRLAREIHDTIAQSLAGIVTQLEAAVGGERQARALALAREALGEARRSVLDLAPADLDGSALPDALAVVVRGWSEQREVRADLVVTGEPLPLHPEVEATVLRIAQESLTNVAKHASADRVGVTLSYDGDEVVLDVRDDGVGFDPAAAAAHSSFGLRGMRQRTERLAGVLAVESGPGSGTAVSVRLPALSREAA